jgi:Spy/CpxP family protein refolding chaperone
MRRWIILVVAGAMLSLPMLASAQGFGGRRGERGQEGMRGPRLMAMLENDRVKSALGLTDEQTAKLRQIMVDGRKSAIKTRADLEVQNLELRELLRADQPNRDAVLRKVQEISQLRGEMMQQRVESLLSAKSVLTAEQQQKIRQFMSEHRGRRAAWRRDRRPGGPGGFQGGPGGFRHGRGVGGPETSPPPQPPQQ